MQEFETLKLHNGPLDFSTIALGTGPLVMCLHGFPDNARSYRHQLPVLAEAGYRAISVTLRGYESSSQPTDGSYQLEDLALDVVAFLDQLQVDQTHLVGHDWGAAIAYTTGALAPTRFRSLTTMAVPHSGRFITEVFRHPRQLRLSWYMLFFQLRGLADHLVDRDDFAFIKKLWRDWSPDWTLPESELEQVIETFRQPGVRKAELSYYRAALSLRALPLGKQAREAARFPVLVPTMALTGARDGCIDSKIFQKLMYEEDFPNGLEVRQILGAGHFPHQEQPEAVNELLLNWLRRHEGN